MGVLNKLRLYATAASYIPLRSLALYGRRRVYTAQLRRNFAGMVRTASVGQREALLRNITSPSFLAAAKCQLDITRSIYGFDPAGPTLLFLKSGDTVDLRGIKDIPWREKGAIPASDVNRCYFISFVEQGPLAVLDDPAAGLAHLADVVRQLAAAARPTERFLTFPWQPLPAARRLVNLLIGLALALDADSSLAAHPDVEPILDQVLTCAAVVDRLREDDLGYNHLATAIFGQCFHAAAVGDSALLARRSREFVASMQDQVGSDGLQLERSGTYQAHMLGHVDVLLAGNMIADDVRPQAEALAVAMRHALAVITHRDGGIAVFNDSAEGDGPSPASLHVDPAALADGLHRLPEGGFVRLEGQGLSVVFDTGRCAADDTPGHAHADFLAIELSVDGRRFIVDPGVATYKAGPERDWTRSSHSHNGPALAGFEPLEFFGAFRVARRGRAYEIASPLDTPLTAAGTQTGFDRFGARVGRAIAVWPGAGLLIVDVWRGQADREAQLNFIVDGAWHAEADAAGTTFATADGKRLVVEVSGGAVALAKGRHYRFGPRREMPATELRVEVETRPLRHCATIIRHPGAVLPIDAAAIDAAAQALLARLDDAPIA